MFRTVSQIAINYRGSALSIGKAGKVHGGDRLPWVEPDPAMPGATDNHAPLASLQWQVHVYGVASQTLHTTCREHDIAVHELPWSVRAHRAGLERDTAYLVRPDGYVAIAIPSQASAVLATFLTDWKLGRTSCSRTGERFALAIPRHR